MNFSKEIGALLRKHRTKKNLTLRNVGDVVGVSFQQMQKYEAGRNEIALRMMSKLITILDIPHDELLITISPEINNASQIEKRITNAVRKINDDKMKKRVCLILEQFVKSTKCVITF
jgi:transcriptional regulator with XRE-family HTH domain